MADEFQLGRLAKAGRISPKALKKARTRGLKKPKGLKGAKGVKLKGLKGLKKGGLRGSQISVRKPRGGVGVGMAGM